MAASMPGQSSAAILSSMLRVMGVMGQCASDVLGRAA
jgi:hypothetical protein